MTAPHDSAARPARHRHPAAAALFWLGWALAGIAVEIWALFHSGTLTQTWRDWVLGDAWPASVPKSAGWAGRVLILLFSAWLGLHLAGSSIGGVRL